jgi:hypothetical protein
VAIEWFAPGHAPADTCRWHDAQGGVRLPVEYAEWAERAELPQAERPSAAGAAQVAPVAAGAAHEFRIVSPSQGDVYRMPPGIEPRYATVALRVAGGPADAAVRWLVDGSAYHESRWPLQPGSHRFRAVSSAGDSAEVSVRVE